MWSGIVVQRSAFCCKFLPLHTIIYRADCSAALRSPPNTYSYLKSAYRFSQTRARPVSLFLFDHPQKKSLAISRTAIVSVQPYRALAHFKFPALAFFFQEFLAISIPFQPQQVVSRQCEYSVEYATGATSSLLLFVTRRALSTIFVERFAIIVAFCFRLTLSVCALPYRGSTI